MATKGFYSSETERKGHREKLFICWFLPQTPPIVRAGPQSGSLTWQQGPNTLRHHCLPPKLSISRQLELEHSGGSNSGTLIGEGASQAPRLCQMCALS